MSHVDEGELTAYADGAYPAGDIDAQRIEAHLALCANCRNRLDQARALSSRAAEILSAAAPIDVEMPEFAEIRSAAAVAPRRRAAIPLSWAATVILALGIGWFGRSAVMTPTSQRTVTTAQPQLEQASDVAAAAPEPAASPPELRPTEGTGAAARRANARRPLAKEETQAANALDEATDVPTVAAAPPPSAVDKPLSLERRAAVGQAAGAAAPEIDYITAAEAERRGIALHIVPELEVLRVGLRNDEVRVEQKLPDGRVLTISSIAMQEADFAAKQAAAEPSARAREQRAEMLRDAAEHSVVVNRGTVRLRLSAALPEDSLRALAGRIR